jgi:hypothetical protein
MILDFLWAQPPMHRVLLPRLDPQLLSTGEFTLDRRRVDGPTDNGFLGRSQAQAQAQQSSPDTGWDRSSCERKIVFQNRGGGVGMDYCGRLSLQQPFCRDLIWGLLDVGLAEPPNIHSENDKLSACAEFLIGVAGVAAAPPHLSRRRIRLLQHHRESSKDDTDIHESPRASSPNGAFSACEGIRLSIKCSIPFLVTKNTPKRQTKRPHMATLV